MPDVRLALLAPEDADDILQFELANRDYFTRAVGDRGDDFFASYASRHQARVEENRDGTSLLFVIRDEDGRLVGRVNVLDIAEDEPELGYRIGEEFGGRGYARMAVRLALVEAARHGVRRVRAMTTIENIGSQKVLAANGFASATGEPAHIVIAGETRPVLHFAKELS